jgi:hypothetical protein
MPRNRTYSCGYSSGLAPDSLLLTVCERITITPKSGAKIEIKLKLEKKIMPKIKNPKFGDISVKRKLIKTNSAHLQYNCIIKFFPFFSTNFQKKTFSLQ